MGKTASWTPQETTVAFADGKTFVAASKRDMKLRKFIGVKAKGSIPKWYGVVDSMSQARTDAQTAWVKRQRVVDDPLQPRRQAEAEARRLRLDLPQHIEIWIPPSLDSEPHTMRVMTAASAREMVYFELDEANLDWMRHAYATGGHDPKPRATRRNTSARHRLMSWTAHADQGKRCHASKHIRETSDGDKTWKKFRRAVAKLQQTRDENGDDIPSGDSDAPNGDASDPFEPPEDKGADFGPCPKRECRLCPTCACEPWE